MREDELLINRLKAYTASKMLPFHMPGHKRRSGAEGSFSFPDPFSIDITEIEGFDNLHCPEGILRDSMAWTAGIYGTRKTWYLVNGSSAGILAAVCGTVCRGSKILMARNCHKSAYHAVILRGLAPVYLYPQPVPAWGINGGILPEDVDKMLRDDPEIAAVLIVSPTYEGIVSDIRSIAEAVHEHGKVLVVDEAHGAHFSFAGGDRRERFLDGRKGFAASAVSCGADLVVQSLHKTLPSLTQTAVLHLCTDRVDPVKIETYLRCFQSSSPSYVLMASIENCIYQMAFNGPALLEEFCGRLDQFRERMQALRSLRLLGEEQAGHAAVFDVDSSRIVVSCRGCRQRIQKAGDVCDGAGAANALSAEEKSSAGYGRPAYMTGRELAARLQKEFRIETEMSGADYVVAIASLMDGEPELAAFGRALLAIDRDLIRIEEDDRAASQEAEFFDGLYPDECLPMSDAAEAPCEAVPFFKAAGRVSAAFVSLYPPGIPFLVPGELITEREVSLVRQYQRLGLIAEGLTGEEKTDFLVIKP